MSSRRLGNYQITEYVGGGGFGSVFKAEDTTKPGRIVAIKELHKKHTRNAAIKQRFFQEAVAMARLDHPNLPRLFTFGEDNGCYYLVMEFLSGKPLGDEISETGAVSPTRAVAITTQVLEALAYAHKSGIIHRDLKPDNIMLLQGGSALQIKVLDFGIARIVGGENLTVTGEGLGTPAYMSPERIMGTAGNDPRIDIYSVGIILYEMLSGKPPFESTASDPAIYWMEMRTQHEVEPLPSLVPLGAPVELDRIIQRAAAKRLEDRYPSAGEMLADLKECGITQEFASTAPLSNARLALSIQPGTADVYVDDAFHGSADERGRIVINSIQSGIHTVRVCKEGYSDYQINVALEGGRQTELQVALAARPTVIAPPAASTAAGGFETVRFQGPEDARTALLVIDSLPAGTTVFVGDKSMALADEDGKATLRLGPGDHEIKVASPSGESVRRRITLTSKDTGSQQVLTLPLGRATTNPPQPISFRPSGSPSAGKRWATAGAVVLLFALAASAAYVFVFQRGSRPAVEQAQQMANAQDAAPEPASAAQAAPVQETESKPAPDLKKQLQEAESEKANLEKKLAAEERKKAEGTSSPPREPDTPEPPKEALAPPTTREAGQHPEDSELDLPASNGNACLMVNVRGPGGQPGPRLRVLMTEQAGGNRSIAMKGVTNQRGIVRQCGFTPNHDVMVTVFGPAGRLLVSKATTVSAGRNYLSIVVVPPNDVSPSGERFPFRRRRP
jgi:serine/threonine-protein kinase